jgi:hypothetical protein
MFGFRFWKITSGVIGFIFAFFITYFLVVYFMNPNTPNAVYIALGSGLGAGLLVGLILFFFPLIALVIISIFIGMALGVLLYNIAFVYTGWIYSYYISVGVSALVVLILALLLKKTFIVIMTSFYGAFAIAYGMCLFGELLVHVIQQVQ